MSKQDAQLFYHYLLSKLFFSVEGSEGWDQGLNSGLCTCKAGTVLLEPHLQPISFWLFWRWGLANYLPAVGHEP
jgi:hypothetical protein